MTQCIAAMATTSTAAVSVWSSQRAAVTSLEATETEVIAVVIEAVAETEVMTAMVVIVMVTVAETVLNVLAENSAARTPASPSLSKVYPPLHPGKT